MAKLAWTMALLILVSSAYAEIFMHEDNSGNITFSDQPINEDTKPVKLDPINEAPDITPENEKTTPEVSEAENETVPVQPVAIEYRSFNITTPTDQQNFHNQTSIPVYIGIDPALQEGDKIQLMYDGKSVGPAIPSTSFRIENPYRGTHTIKAMLFNENNQLVKSTPTITIYVHQATVNKKIQ